MHRSTRRRPAAGQRRRGVIAAALAVFLLASPLALPALAKGPSLLTVATEDTGGEVMVAQPSYMDVWLGSPASVMGRRGAPPELLDNPVTLTWYWALDATTWEYDRITVYRQAGGDAVARVDHLAEGTGAGAWYVLQPSARRHLEEVLDTLDGAPLRGVRLDPASFEFVAVEVGDPGIAPPIEFAPSGGEGRTSALLGMAAVAVGVAALIAGVVVRHERLALRCR